MDESFISTLFVFRFGRFNDLSVALAKGKVGRSIYNRKYIDVSYPCVKKKVRYMVKEFGVRSLKN